MFFFHLGGPANGHAAWSRYAEETPGVRLFNMITWCTIYSNWIYRISVSHSLSSKCPGKLNIFEHYLSCFCFQCSIDLKKNLLLIGTTGTETRFLSEAELPECARLAYGAEGREDTRPDEIADRELAEALQRSIQENRKK